MFPNSHVVLHSFLSDYVLGILMAFLSFLALNEMTFENQVVEPRLHGFTHSGYCVCVTVSLVYLIFDIASS